MRQFNQRKSLKRRSRSCQEVSGRRWRGRRNDQHVQLVRPHPLAPARRQRRDLLVAGVHLVEVRLGEDPELGQVRLGVTALRGRVDKDVKGFKIVVL